MLQNYLRSALGNLLRNPSHTFITVLGLALGMASCILILLYVRDELSFDRWLPQAEAVYRVETQYQDAAGNERLVRKTALRARRDLQAHFPQIEAATRVIDDTVTLSAGDSEYFETVWFVDPGFLDVFQLPLLAGSSMALGDRRSLLISAATARKYFGDGAAVGRIITLDEAREFRVAGVFADMPRNSHVKFGIVAPYDEADPAFNFGYSEDWGAVEGYTYVKFAAATDIGAIAAELPAFLAGQRNPPPQLRLLNLRDIHLDAGGIGNIETPGNRQMLVTLTGIALLVLAIAAINFVNLSTVRALDRGKEVSVRKAVGALRRQLVAQFLCESVLVALLALIVAASIVELVLPSYNALLGRDIDIDYLSMVPVVLVFLSIVLGLVSGVVPAHRLAAWQPATLLRAGTNARQGKGRLQACLVTAQFAISATLVMTTLAVLLQQSFVEARDLGYTPRNKLVVRNLDEDVVAAKRELLAEQIGLLPEVLGTAFAAATPGDTTGAGFFRPVSGPGAVEAAGLYPKGVDANFFDVYGVPVIHGRGFSSELASDRFLWDAPTARAAAILNVAATQAVGFASADAAVGKLLRMGEKELEIIGVVPDLNFQTLRNAVTPNLYIFSQEDFPTLTVAYADGADTEALVAGIARVWESLVPGRPLELDFVEDTVRAQYAQDRLQFLLIAVFASLAITIACMGLYALAAWSTRRRTREIGIRKVHGALSAGIMSMLLLQFSKPLVLANLLAWPVAWYCIDRYLEGFAYRIELGPGLFIAASLATIAIAWAAIVLHVARAANAKPVLALRHE